MRGTSSVPDYVPYMTEGCFTMMVIVFSKRRETSE